MAATGNLSVSGNVSNNVGNTQITIGPLSVTTNAAVPLEQTVTLTTGANTVSLPTGITCLIIVGPNGANPKPNPTYGGTLTVKGIAGDTGIPISSTNPVMYTWDSTTAAPSSIIINASSGTTITLWGF